MKEEEWVQLRERGTGQFMEMVNCYRRSRTGKISGRTRKELLQAVAESLGAMANAGGGRVLLGADPEGETLGVFFDDRERHLFFRSLQGSFHPPFPIRISQEEVDGKTLLQFTVSASPVTHLLTDGKGYLRVGPQNVPLSKERMATLREVRAETWHEREILPGSSLADLDGNLVNDFLTQLSFQGDMEKILHRPYGLIEYLEGKPVLNRAAAYLFGKDPLRWHPRPGMEFVRFEGAERRGGSDYNVAERVRVESPVLRLIQEAVKVIGARVQERVLPRDLFFREKFEYPAFTWKEALINAIAHRDYSLEGSAISVWMFEDRIEVRSPGKLPGPMKAQKILGQERIHYARNPLMTRVLTDAGFMRSLGDGLPRVFQEMDHQGLNAPEWRDEEGFCCFIFRNTPILDESTLAWLKQFSDYILNPRQRRILTYAKVHGGIFSSSDYQKFGVDRDGAYTEIKNLVLQGIVEPLKKHGKVYRIREIKEETGLPGLTWVVEPLRGKGYFTLQELKVPESVPQRKVKGIIRVLVKDGYFSPSGKGRAARYHPTEKMNELLQKANDKKI
jgi:ATP-dependent DNA helicase RecG